MRGGVVLLMSVSLHLLGLRSVVPNCLRDRADEAHGSFGEGGNRKAGIHSQVGSDDRSITDVHVRITENAMAMVDDSIVGRTSHDAAAEAMRRARHLEKNFGQHAHRGASGELGKFLCEVV